MEGFPCKSHLFAPGKDKSAVFINEKAVILEAVFAGKPPERPPVPDHPLHPELLREALHEDEHNRHPQQPPMHPERGSVPAAQTAVKTQSVHGQPPRQGQHVAYSGPADPTLPAGLGIGSPVQLKMDPYRIGVIRWIGTLSEIQGSIAGVELVSDVIIILDDIGSYV